MNSTSLELLSDWWFNHTQVALEFVYLAVGAGVASFLRKNTSSIGAIWFINSVLFLQCISDGWDFWFPSEVACWMATGERQSARIRNLYLKTILRHEIAFFDKETKTGEVVERMSGDTVFIQDAMGEKVPIPSCFSAMTFVHVHSVASSCLPLLCYPFPS